MIRREYRTFYSNIHRGVEQALAIANTFMLQKISTSLTKSRTIHLLLKRDDLLDADIIGNKWRKLQPHIAAINSGKYRRIVTLGGAYSNHILSTSYLTKRYGIASMAYVRGDELNKNSNEVLRQSSANGMELRFVRRSEYRSLRSTDFTRTIGARDDDYCLAEGGMSALSMEGCRNIINEIEMDFDWLFCACGTGTTISGIAQAAQAHHSSAKLVGVCALLPGSMIRNNIIALCGSFPENLELCETHAGSFGKPSQSVADLMHRYHKECNVEFDFNYTAKMMACVEDFIEKGIIKTAQTVVAIHTGGQETAGVRHLNR